MNKSSTQKLWETMSEYKDLPDEIVTEIRQAFATHQRCSDLWQTKRTALQQIINALNDAQRQSAPKLFAELQTGKKNSLTQMTDQIMQLTEAQTEAQLAERFAKQAERKAEFSIASPLTNHRESLIVWVAQRRIIEPFACGYTSNMTKEVESIWTSLNIQMQSRFDEALELPEMNRLPIVFDDRWTPKTISSLSWIWQQIAEARFDFVPHQNNQNSKLRSMRITAFPSNIPQAPTMFTRR